MSRLLLLILVLNAVGVRAAEFESVANIRLAAEQAVAGSGVAQASVDEGMRLPRCGQPLTAAPASAGTVEVACPDAGWRLFVPVRVQRLQQVYVLRQPVSAGQLLGPDNLASELRDVTRLPGAALSTQTPLLGRTARRPMLAGSVLLSDDAVSPRTIHRGDPVTLLSRMGQIEVRAAGRALAAAGVDERLSVENLSSRRVVQGIVLSSGEVAVMR